jgi:hypothetical protein
VGAIAAAVLAAGAVNGVGPLSSVTPASAVTVPAEMLARSLQAVVDASSVHVAATVSGRVPGALVGRPEAVAVLDGTTASLDMRPQDARTRLVFSSASLDLDLDALTAWDTMAYRLDGGEWSKGSLASVLAGTGIDADPLTIVDRTREWLAAPGAPQPAATTVPCDAPSGRCRHVVVALGREAGDVLLAAFPEGRAVQVGPTTTEVSLLADAATLRPAHLTLAIRSDDGSVDVTVAVDFSLWDWPSVIEDPPAG